MADGRSAFGPHLDDAAYFPQVESLRWRDYFRCLLCLESLLTNGSLACLPSTQEPKYYACVLAAHRPEDIPPGLVGKAYSECCNTLPMALCSMIPETLPASAARMKSSPL